LIFSGFEILKAGVINNFFKLLYLSLKHFDNRNPIKMKWFKLERSAKLRQIIGIVVIIEAALYILNRCEVYHIMVGII
jgi:uncharacterized membrane protein YkgB